MGATDIHELPWLDAPPAPALGQARALLADLELLDAKYRLTDHGRHAHRLGADRVAHLLTRGVELEAAYPGAVATACLLAAALAIATCSEASPTVDLRRSARCSARHSSRRR